MAYLEDDIAANKALVRRYFETFNAGDLNGLDEILALAS